MTLRERINWWVYRKRLWWAYVRESGRMLNRRVHVEQVLLDVAKGKRGPLSAHDAYELAMYLGSPTRMLPRLDCDGPPEATHGGVRGVGRMG